MNNYKLCLLILVRMSLADVMHAVCQPLFRDCGQVMLYVALLSRCPRLVITRLSKSPFVGCVPSALSWGQALVAAGTDGKVVMYDGNGTVQQQFNYGADEVRLYSLR
jgi:hypothetical protein